MILTESVSGLDISAYDRKRPEGQNQCSETTEYLQTSVSSKVTKLYYAWSSDRNTCNRSWYDMNVNETTESRGNEDVSGLCMSWFINRFCIKYINTLISKQVKSTSFDCCKRNH